MAILRPLTTRINNRTFLRLTGDDRVTFLQGLVSNDVAQCVKGTAVYAGILTPQGKFLFDVMLYADGASILIDCEATRCDALIDLLKKHKLRARVDLASAADEYDLWAVWRTPIPPAQGLLFHDPRHPTMGQRLLLKKGQLPRGADIVGFDAYDTMRIKLALPDGSRDMVTGLSTLLEGGFDKIHGIDWNKGCYMGQELTARMHHRGLLKRRLMPVTLTGHAPAFDSPITLNGQECGSTRSYCGQLGLAVLDVGLAVPGTVFDYQGGTITPLDVGGVA